MMEKACLIKFKEEILFRLANCRISWKISRESFIFLRRIIMIFLGLPILCVRIPGNINGTIIRMMGYYEKRKIWCETNIKSCTTLVIFRVCRLRAVSFPTHYFVFVFLLISLMGVSLSFCLAHKSTAFRHSYRPCEQSMGTSQETRVVELIFGVMISRKIGWREILNRFPVINKRPNEENLPRFP